MIPCPQRRRFLHLGTRGALSATALATGGGLLGPGEARAGALAAAATPPAGRTPDGLPVPAEGRHLGFAHTHTGERLHLVFAVGAHYLDDALAALNRLLRDHYSGQVGRIDPALFDQLHRVQQLLGSRGPFEVISGFRAAATNERLRQTRGGGVARRSLHLDGRAIDIRLPDVPLADLRDAARAMRAGGVGFYPREQFVHLDTGPVRAW